MATPDPVSTGFALLFDTLTSDATFMSYVAAVYQVMAPPGSTPNYALLILQTGQDVNSATAVRIMSSLLFQVKIVGPVGNAASLRAAYARADALLMPNGQPLRNMGGTLAVYREQTLSIAELVGGAVWLNYGGLYRVEI